MPNPEINLDIKKIAWVIFNVFRWIALAGFVYGLVGLIFSIKNNYYLWVSPLHTEGIVIGYEEKSWQSRTNGEFITTSTKLPIVEFQDASNAAIRFTDHVGSSNAAGYKNKVHVIYSIHDPSNARIDKGLLFNWIDTYIWLFLTFCGLLGIVRLSKDNIATMLRKLDSKNA
jgi:hypothetical protein